jgi:hypothetical protein
LKNSLLIVLIVLIIHFMIKNRMLDDIDMYRRRLVHDDTMNDHTLGGSKVNGRRCMSNVKVNEEENLSNCRKVRFNRNDDEDLKKCDMENLLECVGNVTCDDMTKTDNDMPELASEENKMKELYDFVFLEDSNANSSKGLNDFFPDDVKDDIIFDKTEIDVHNNAVVENKFAENKNGHCNFEVIGLIEKEDESDVYGLDSLTSTNFSNL